MVSEKQIEAVKWSIKELSAIADWKVPDEFEHLDALCSIVTAAEKADPLDNDVEVHRWQRATAVQSRKLQMVLDIPGVKERLQEVTGSSDGYMLAGIEQAKPAPAARSGAVREKDPRHFDILVEAMAEVKATSDGLSDQPIADIVQGCIDEIEALEPAEPAAEVEPFGYWVKHKYADGGLLRPPAFIPENNHYTEVIALYTHQSPSEARLREAAREAVNCLTHHAEDNENTRWVLSLLNAALKEASDERAQEDGR